MIYKHIKYKGVWLSEHVALTNRIVVQKFDHYLPLRTDFRDRENFHGTYSSFTLGGGRRFDISGQIFADSDIERYTGKAILDWIIRPENNPHIATDESRWFHELQWTDEGNNIYKTKAKVIDSTTKYYKDLGKTIIDFAFTLYSEDSFYDMIPLGSTGECVPWEIPWIINWDDGDICISGQVGYLDHNLSFSLPRLTAYTNTQIINNPGSASAQMKFTITGLMQDMTIMNLTNGWVFSISGSTSSIVVNGYDATTKESGVSIINRIVTGSSYITLSPWDNEIVILTQSYWKHGSKCLGIPNLWAIKRICGFCVPSWLIGEDTTVQICYKLKSL